MTSARQRATLDVTVHARNANPSVENGHPRTLEYLDALPRGGQARFDDVVLRPVSRPVGRVRHAAPE
ncbi:MAG: hypothetical protein ACRDZO_18480 [Egibacteraceae bacterium]